MTADLAARDLPGGKRVPVRIQVWVDDWRLDIRGWLDEFTATNDISDLGAPPMTVSQWGRHDYTLQAHNDWNDAPWRFERGKPKVESHD